MELIQNAIDHCEDQARQAKRLQRVAGISGNREAAGDWRKLARARRRDGGVNMRKLTRLVKVG